MLDLVFHICSGSQRDKLADTSSLFVQSDEWSSIGGCRYGV